MDWEAFPVYAYVIQESEIFGRAIGLPSVHRLILSLRVWTSTRTGFLVDPRREFAMIGMYMSGVDYDR